MNMTQRKYLPMLLAGLTAATLTIGQAQAAVSYANDATNTVSIPGLTGFGTTGAMMSGMTVTATFAGGTEVAYWGTTGAISGGVSGSGWSISQSDTTYDSPWNFAFAAGTALQLTKLVFNGATGLTVFDRTFGDDWGPDGSAPGFDLAFSDRNISA